jgi:hypothetical protein
MAILVQSNKKPSVSYPEQTGAIITFNSQYAGLPLKSCKVNIPITQEGTGDPSPDNVRNFVGIFSLDFTANSVVRTFQFGQTIYAGELDILAGTFTATHKLIDLSSLNYNTASWGAYRTQAPSDCIVLLSSSSSDSYASIYIYTTQRELKNDMPNNHIALQGANIYIVSDSTPTGYLLYELATPEVINLGGMNIETLQGENNLFASTGDTTAQYIKIGG